MDQIDELKQRRMEEQRKQAAQDALDFKEVSGTVAGRRFLRRLLADTGVFRSTYSTDHSAASFNEGRRSIGLFILDEFEQHAPNHYLQMIREKDE